MRTAKDRLRHAIGFELVALMIVIPFGVMFFHMPASDIGLITIVSAFAATGWNYVYNLGFDRMMKRRTGSVDKSLSIRIVHAILFEFGLLAILMPFIAIYLGVSMIEALILDLSLALFYVVYAFFYNLTYDHLFQIPADPS
ncbi:putative membrane protein [Agrobacterium vitis]|nr:putative membrane protein [Agrobacterium vitis]MBE1439540.1 putative membrane protein [Agrobacterium vitis]